MQFVTVVLSLPQSVGGIIKAIGPRMGSGKGLSQEQRKVYKYQQEERKMKIMTELKRRPIGSSKTKIEDVKKIKIMSSCGNRTVESNIIDFPNSLHGVKRYASNMKCTWTIFWDYDYVIKFKRFDLEESENCEYDYFRVADGEKLCGRNILPNDVYVDNTVGKVRLMFRSDGYTNGEGFKVQILKMEKGRVKFSCSPKWMSSLKDLKKICGHRRVKFSPHKNGYRNWNVPIKKSISGIECFYRWNQCSKMGYSFALVFTRFNLKYDQKCEYSYLQVNGREKLCGSEVPNPVFMDLGINSTQLTFFSTGSGAKQNFELRILEINDESDVYVSAEGNNSAHCGSANIPCKTINYAINGPRQKSTRYTRVVHIYVLSSVEESETVFARRSGNFIIKGMCEAKPNITIKGVILFSVFKTVGGTVKLSFKDVLINIDAGFLYVTTEHTFIKVEMTNVVLVHNDASERRTDDVISLKISGSKNRSTCHCSILIVGCIIKNTDPSSLLSMLTSFCTSSLTIVDTTLHNNSFHQKFFLLKPRHSSLSIFLNNITAYRNRGKSSLFDVTTDEETSELNMVLKDSTFEDNQVEDYGGLISITKTTRLKESTNSRKHFTLIMDGVRVHNNRGTALIVKHIGHCELKGKCPEGERLTKINVTVRSCLFTNNIGLPCGGAVMADTNSYSSLVRLDITSSKFHHNQALSGGAIYSNVQTRIRTSEFLYNHAAMGGTIMFRSTTQLGVEKEKLEETNVGRHDYGGMTISRIEDSIIFTTSAAMDTMMRLDAANLTIKLSDHVVTKTEIFRHLSPTQRTRLTGTIDFNCGLNRNITHLTQKLMYKGGREVFLSHLSVFCQACSKGTYNIEKGEAKLHNSTVSASNVKCYKCPRGANCEEGSIRSRQKYWGFQSKENKELKFVLCPVGYCSGDSSSYNSCSTNRHGTLCGECKKNTSVSMMSSKCVDTANCDIQSSHHIFTISPFVLILLVIALIFKDGLISVFERLIKFLRSLKKPTVASTHVKTLDNMPTEVANTADKSSTLKQFLLIVSFYQLQVLIYLPNKAIIPLWRTLQHDLGMISMLNFLGGDQTSTVTPCFPTYFTFIHQTLLNMVISLSPILISLLVYILVILFERFSNSETSFKLKITSAVITFVGISYIPFAKSLFHLVTCVEIIQNGKDVMVLIGQGSIKCFSGWQYGIIAFLCLYVAWYFLFLLVGTLYLKKQKETEFWVMASAPVTSLYFLSRYTQWISFSCCSVSNREGEKMIHQREKSPLFKDDDMDDGSDDKSSPKEQVEEPLDPSFKHVAQPQHVLTLKCDKLIAAIQEPCRVIYWPSVVVLRNLSVAFVPVLFRHDYSQVLALLVILLTYFSLLIRVQPYADRVMNVLEPILISVLLLFGVLGVVNTTYLTSSDNNIESFLVIIDQIMSMLLITPIPVWIILIVIMKCSDREETQTYKCADIPSANDLSDSMDFNKSSYKCTTV